MQAPPDEPLSAASTAAAAQADAVLPPLDLVAVEERVRDTGAFNALDWLLDTGLLLYADYERWRRGELPDLEAALTCDARALAEHLERLQTHARTLGLSDHPRTYYSWQPGEADKGLALSRHSQRAALFAQHWQRPQGSGQLDLFMDSGASVAERALCHALAAHNPEAAAAAYDRLCALAPNHARLGDYDNLLIYCRHLQAEPVVAAEACADELQGLETEIAPLAHELLGAPARDYLAPAWRRVATALPETELDPDHPERHASHAWLQLPEPTAARMSIESVADYDQHPILLVRLAQALQLERQPNAALLVQARCLELAPQTARGLLEPKASTDLHRHLQAFDDLEPALEPDDFPAWLLLHAPGLLETLERTAQPCPRGAGFEAAWALLRARQHGGDEMAARQRLRAASPALFRIFMDGR